LSIAQQCELLGLPRSTWYYEPVGETAENLALMRRIDEVYLRWPFYGSRKIAEELGVNRKRVQRLMRQMGLQAIYPKRRTTWPGAGHKIYPYLLRDIEVTRPDQVWATDITYVPMRHGFLYLVAIMDWYSRYVLSWRLSNTLEGTFCVEALEEALRRARPEIFNSDQGSQFTAAAFTGRLEACGVAISMDGRGRAIDNVFVERLGGGGLAVRLLSLLLPSTDSSGPGLPHAGRGLLQGGVEGLQGSTNWRKSTALRAQKTANSSPMENQLQRQRPRETFERSRGPHLNQPHLLSNDWGPPHCILVATRGWTSVTLKRN
jgi:putative transposase